MNKWLIKPSLFWSNANSYRSAVNMERSIKYLVYLGLLIPSSWADVAHFFSPEFGLYPHYTQNYHPQQQNFIQGLQPPQHSLPNLYGAPPNQNPAHGYPNPAAPTPSPVVPLPTSTTTEFTLPEIVENRIVKDRVNFIPLSHQYLPPLDGRPNYENPKPQAPSVGEDSSVANNDGYYYLAPPPKPVTTTTERPTPIVVMDLLEVVPPNQGIQGYDYNAPPMVIVTPVRPSTPAPAYLPPSEIFAQDEAAVVESTSGSVLRVRVQEMRCLQNPGGYFRTVLKVDSFIGATPSVDNDSIDKRCELKLQRSYVVVDIAAEDFQKCGVHLCGTDLCLRLRFPTIRGIRTGADAILTLHCRSQDRIAMKTHALKMGVSNDVQARSLGTYAHGGSQNPFRTHIELLRKSNNGFTRLLESNGAVQLGEELLLRAHVLTGDGWNFTKLSDVSLQRISPSGELLNSAQLISTRGCINPAMKAICEHASIFDPPLGHKLVFKAVMFQGMRSGDEMVMSMRITGCLEHQDCLVSAQECSAANLGRRRRNAAETQDAVNSTEISEISRISFKVLMKPEDALMENANDALEASVHPQRWIILCSTLVFVSSLCGLGLFVALKLRK